jgi:DNA-binding MarR family transcriptional regulator
MQDDRLRGSLAHAVVRLFRQVNRVHNRRFAGVGISAEQAHILSILRLEGPLTMGRLQRLLSLSSATLTGAIDRLEALELVRRVPSPEDRRAFVIESRLSAKKQAALWDAIDAAIDDGERRCFAVLTAAERRELLRLIEKCSAHLDVEAAAR